MIKAIQVDEFYFHENGEKIYELDIHGLLKMIEATEADVYNLLLQADEVRYEIGVIFIRCGKMTIGVHSTEN